jgi:hypothetical protein
LAIIFTAPAPFIPKMDGSGSGDMIFAFRSTKIGNSSSG